MAKQLKFAEVQEIIGDRVFDVIEENGTRAISVDHLREAGQV